MDRYDYINDKGYIVFFDSCNKNQMYCTTIEEIDYKRNISAYFSDEGKSISDDYKIKAYLIPILGLRADKDISEIVSESDSVYFPINGMEWNFIEVKQISKSKYLLV